MAGSPRIVRTTPGPGPGRQEIQEKHAEGLTKKSPYKALCPSAHASQLCDACAPTELLGTWVRDSGVLSLEEGVRQLTAQPAEVFGITDRGRLAVGMAADVTIFDPQDVGCTPLRRVHDFPAGADRLVSDARGIRAVIVNGEVIRQENRDAVDVEGPLPGRLLRAGRARG